MRIRTIKPEFWSHPVMGKQDDSVKLLAIGLLNLADDEGYFFADPTLIKSTLFPYKNESLTNHGSISDGSVTCHNMVKILQKIGYLEICQHPTHGTIGRIVSFKDHQVINRPKPSKIKHLWTVTDESLTDHGSITDASRIDHAGKEGNGKEGNGREEKGRNSPAETPKEKQGELVSVDADASTHAVSEIAKLLQSTWNEQKGVKQCAKVTPARQQQIRLRLKDRFFADNWQRAMQKVGQSKFCTGQGSQGWRADFDWFLRANTVVQIIEGKYDGSKPTGGDLSDFSRPAL